MHSLAQALHWFDTHEIGWSFLVLFVGMVLIVLAAAAASCITWRWTHRHEIREEREMAARVERLRG